MIVNFLQNVIVAIVFFFDNGVRFAYIKLKILDFLISNGPLVPLRAIYSAILTVNGKLKKASVVYNSMSKTVEAKIIIQTRNYVNLQFDEDAFIL